MTDPRTVELLVADSESTKQFSLGGVLTDVQWDTTLLDQPGKLTFTIVESGSEFFYEGSNVVLTVGGIKIFDGYLFERSRSEKDTMKCTCYDRLRYLNNKDTYVFTNATPSEIFTTICTEQQLPFKITNGSDYKTAPIAHDNKSLYSMIIRALDEAFVFSKQYLIVRDNAGTLEMINIENMLTNVFIGDESLLKGFDFVSSIDKQTYNYVKLIQEDKDKKIRHKYIAMDTSTIYKWGRLQYFEKMDEDANEAQIQERAMKVLNHYNRKTKTLKVTCLGDFQVQAGSGVGVGIKKVENEGIAYMQYAFASKVSHHITQDIHTMSLDLEVV